MRYVIARHKFKAVLLFILLGLCIVSIAPWVYERIFIQEEPFGNIAYYSPLAPEGIEINSGTFLDVDFLNDGYVFSRFRLEDFKIKDLVVSATVVTKGQIIRDKDGKEAGFSGKLSSRDIVLDSNEFLPLDMLYEIKGDVLEIRELRLGNSCRLKGNIGLAEPFNVDLHIDIIRADMRRISGFTKIKGHDLALGIVSASFDIKGDIAGNIFSEGAIESRNGKIGPVGYNFVTLKLEGFGPVINIVDSSLHQDSSSLTMEGYIDLRNIAKGGLLDGLRIKSDMKTIAWDGWDISKDGTDELTMSKDVGENLRVGFKTMRREPITTYEDRENPEEMSLEYKMGLQNLKMKLKEDEEFFGIEHSVKF
ncbi:MAG: hypothetical protein KKD11_00610 [Candidatus Omnitrophica bacterium]|nr:hypothetical protein [Candidatus Omnitrophota bacterium]